MEDLINKIHNADCLDFMKKLPNNCVDLVLTDPPYKQEAHDRGICGKRTAYKEMSEYTNMNNDWYNVSILKEYVRLCKFVNIFLFCGKRDVFKCLSFAEDNGYNYFILPICKLNPIPTTNNTWLANEYAVHITDRKINTSKNYNLKIPYFLTACGNKETKHPNEKNIHDITRIILNLTNKNNIVLDPFIGSGTTAVAAHKTGRQFIGVEIKEQYHRQAEKRLNMAKMQPSLCLDEPMEQFNFEKELKQ